MAKKPAIIINENALTPSNLSFAGYTWTVKDYLKTKKGPGPDLWDGSNTWIDDNGKLHLKLTKGSGKKWYCAEVQTTEKLGFGTYQWKVEERLDLLDKNLVLGLFNYSGNDEFDEMDIEFAKWGDPSNKNVLNYTV